MIREFYLYAEKPIHRIIKEVFMDFQIHTILKKDFFKKNKLTNKNIFLVLNNNSTIDLD